MTLYAVVPVKNLRASKRRLAAVFTPQERRQLTLAMLQDVLTALKASIVDRILVAGEDTQVQKVVENCDAEYLSTAKIDLNLAIEQATHFCVKRDAHSVLVLPADVPLLTAKDIDCIIQLAAKDHVIVLSPSINCGTNALYQSPPQLIPACFGPKSFLEHIREAYGNGLSVRLYFSTGLATDMDSAEDLRKLFEIENRTVCRRVLEEIIRKSPKAREFFAKKN